jgi:hypothetical protein
MKRRIAVQGGDENSQNLYTVVVQVRDGIENGRERRSGAQMRWTLSLQTECEKSVPEYMARGNTALLGRILTLLTLVVVQAR